MHRLEQVAETCESVTKDHHRGGSPMWRIRGCGTQVGGKGRVLDKELVTGTVAFENNPLEILTDRRSDK